jgi:hypothetical protein
MRGAVLLAVLLGGCQTMSRVAEWIDPPPEGNREASLAAAARVDQTGRQIAAANPFTGLDTTFQVIGHPDPLLFHRDHHGVFVSDSLVDQCKSEAELAALLCSELGKMVAEKRNLARMGYVESFPQVPLANSLDAGLEPARLAELAARKEKAEPTDPKAIALDLLKSAGHDANAMKSVEPIIKNANQNREVLRQLGGVGAEPTWSR